MYVILNPKPYDSRPRGRWFVARSGSAQSYTAKLQDAQTFGTVAEAERNRCDGECVLTVEEAMGA